MQERPRRAGPGPALTRLRCSRHRAGLLLAPLDLLSPGTGPAPQLPLTHPGRGRWGDTAASSPAWGASQAPAHTPWSFSPSPKASQRGRALGSHPSLHKALAPQLKGSLRGSCINHPPLQSSPTMGDMESPNRSAGAAAPLHSSSSTCQAFLLCLPSGTNTDRCRHRAPPHYRLQNLADRTTTASSSWNPPSKAAGIGDRTRASP